jgi:hypothetical protein
MKKYYILIGVEILTAVTMKNTIFWDGTMCSPVQVHQHFGGMYCLHFKARRVSQISNQQDLDVMQLLPKYTVSYSRR